MSIGLELRSLRRRTRDTLRIMLLSVGLAPGLLLAAPRLGDPNFERSVVLLARHDEQGALGWVLNGKTLLPVRQLLHDADLVPAGVELPSTPAFSHLVRVGGPVMPGSAWLIYRRHPDIAPFDGEHDLGDDISATGARQAIEAIARGQGPDDFRLFLGYAGWGPKQVETEIGAGAWLPTCFEPALLDLAADVMWEAGYQKAVGTIPMAFTGASRGTA